MPVSFPRPPFWKSSPSDAVYVRLDPAYSVPDKVKVYYGQDCGNSGDYFTGESAEFLLVDANFSNFNCFAIEIQSLPVKKQNGQVRVMEIQLISKP